AVTPRPLTDCGCSKDDEQRDGKYEFHSRPGRRLEMRERGIPLNVSTRWLGDVKLKRSTWRSEVRTGSGSDWVRLMQALLCQSTDPVATAPGSDLVINTKALRSMTNEAPFAQMRSFPAELSKARSD